MAELHEKVTQACNSLGYKLELLEMFSKRAQYDHVKIPVPIYAAKIKAYSVNGNLGIKTWGDLFQSELVSVRGILATNDKLTSMGLAFNAKLT